MTWDREPTPTMDTVPQRQLEALLNTLGFDVETEVEVGVYSLDCYVRELHLGFEADGPTHDTPAGRRYDKQRDDAIYYARGVHIFRAPAIELAEWAVGQDKDVPEISTLSQRVTDFIDAHTDTEHRLGWGGTL